MPQKIFTRTVWLLSFVSLFADVASEMLYPVMPVYLSSIGFSVLAIGILEGVAEAIAGLGKGYFGSLSDKTGNRIAFVRWGYFLSAVSKPLIGITSLTGMVFAARTLDRAGKGVRTAARDALLAAESTPATRARVFGLHRAMDTTGAVLGPAFALVWLWHAPESLRPLFFIAFIPGVISVGLLFILHGNAKQTAKPGNTYRFRNFIDYWMKATPDYRKLVLPLLVFTLFNSSDYFLLMRVKQCGYSNTMLIAIYIGYNMIYALASYPLGSLGDKFGLKRVLVMGLIVFGAVYAGMGIAHSLAGFAALFLGYGIYAAATDGITKAWIANNCRGSDTGTAIGTFTAFQSICTMLASILAGWLALMTSLTFVFVLSGGVAVVVAAYIMLSGRTKQ